MTSYELNIKHISKQKCKVVKYELNIYLAHNWDSLGFRLLDQQSLVHCPDPESANLDWCDPELRRHDPCRESWNLGCPDPDQGADVDHGRDLDQHLEYGDDVWDPNDCECSVSPGCKRKNRILIMQ